MMYGHMHYVTDLPKLACFCIYRHSFGLGPSSDDVSRKSIRTCRKFGFCATSRRMIIAVLCFGHCSALHFPPCVKQVSGEAANPGPGDDDNMSIQSQDSRSMSIFLGNWAR